MATEIAIAVYLGECCGHGPLVLAVFILCSVIFEDDQSATFLRGDKSFRTLSRGKIRTNDITSKLL